MMTCILICLLYSSDLLSLQVMLPMVSVLRLELIKN